MLIKALDPTDPRAATVRVAGFAALLVAKSHKIKDRVDSGREDRVNVKDASDVVQIMNAVNPETMAADLELLGKHPVAAASTRSGLEGFRSLFGNRAGAGIEMAVQSLERAMAEETVRAICLAYAEGLEQALSL